MPQLWYFCAIYLGVGRIYWIDCIQSPLWLKTDTNSAAPSDLFLSVMRQHSRDQSMPKRKAPKINVGQIC